MDVTAGQRDHTGCRRVTPGAQPRRRQVEHAGRDEAGRRAKRFSELKRALDGVSQRMLTLTLRGLERDGLVSRHVTPTIPPRVDYELTELGISLREPVRALGDWAMEHIDCIRAAQQRYDAAQDDASIAPAAIGRSSLESATNHHAANYSRFHAPYLAS